METNWITLSEYSSKYRVSVSTLRRRIKFGLMNFRTVEGKYRVADEPLPAREWHYESQIKPQEDPIMEPISGTVMNLMDEIKKAYRQILQEKEEQIMLLKEEIVDLKTLTRALESENIRLTETLGKSRSVIGLEELSSS